MHQSDLDHGSFDTPTDSTRYAANGRLLLTLRAALHRHDGGHDLVLEIRRRDHVWDRECIAEAYSFNGELHELRLTREDGGRRWHARGLIKPDPWVIAGGPIAVTIDLDDHHGGRYAGTWAEHPVSGTVATRFLADRPVPRGVARKALRILEEPDRLWDFRHAGRGNGADPSTPTDLPLIDARVHGVIADSGRECGPAVQAAIDAAAAAGGGVVQLPAGVLDYRVDSWQPPMVVRHPRIVIRGAGSGPDGTCIVNHRYADYAAAPNQPWQAGAWPMFRFDGRGPAGFAGQMGTDAPPGTQLNSDRILATVRHGVRGAATLDLAPGHGLHPGTTCLLVHEEVDGLPLIEALVGSACTPAAGYTRPGGRPVQQIVTVTAVDGDRVHLADPIHWSTDPAWPTHLLALEPLSDVGIEGLRLRGHWDGHFTHHKSPEHDNGWDHVNFQWCVQSYARDLVHENCTTGIGLGNCGQCTVADIRITGNPGHNGICLGGAATACLLLRCDLERPMHAINLSGTPCGNVIHDCHISEPGGLDLHGSTGLDNMIDRLNGGVLVGGGSPAHVPPRHAGGLVLWNWAQGHYHPYKPWKRVRRVATWRETPGFIAVGVHAADGHHLVYEGPDGLTDDDRHDRHAWVESLNQPVHPTSLYRWQRDARNA